MRATSPPSIWTLSARTMVDGTVVVAVLPGALVPRSDAIERSVAQLSAQQLVVTITYLLVVGAVVAELMWLRGARRDTVRDREAVTAVAMAAGAIAVGVVYTAAFAVLWLAVGSAAPSGLVHVWQRHPAVGLFAAFVAWDAAGFVYHLVGHRTRVGWAAHRPHHTGTRYNVALGLRQSWMPWHGLLITPLVALGGWDLRTIAVCAAVSNLWQLLEHSAAPVPLPAWVRAVVMTPESHRHHHVVDARPVNLGPVLTIWDRLHGTWVPGVVAADAVYGVAEPVSANPLRVELGGWVDLLGTDRGWSGPAPVGSLAPFRARSSAG
jgi:alkylglycerol monooxygenase